MYKRQFIQVLLRTLTFPFVGSPIYGISMGIKYESYWVALESLLYCFIFLAIIYIWINRAPLKSLAKGDRL